GWVRTGWVSTGADFQGRKAADPSIHAADEIRTGDQSANRQGAGHRNSANAARPRRRGDRMTRRSPRAGGSGQERPRLAGKELGAEVSCHYNVRALSRDALWPVNELGWEP